MSLDTVMWRKGGACREACAPTKHQVVGIGHYVLKIELMFSLWLNKETKYFARAKPMNCNKVCALSFTINNIYRKYHDKQYHDIDKTSKINKSINLVGHSTYCAISRVAILGRPCVINVEFYCIYFHILYNFYACFASMKIIVI